MQATRISIVSLTVLAALAWNQLPGAAPALALAKSQSGKRAVVIELIIPTSGEPAKPKLTIREGETATSELEGIGKFGFVPSVPKGQTSTATITMFDASQTPMQRIEDFTLTVKGKPVQTKTKPSFGIALLRVVEPK